MYRWIRTTRVTNGHFPQAIGWAKEIAAFGHKKFGIEIRAYMHAVGEIGTLHWEVDYPDLAAYEKTQAAIMGDPEYWQFLAKAATEGLFIEGSAHDTLLRKL